MKLAVLAVILVMSLAIVGTALAVPPGKTLSWDTPMGKVTFDGKHHADQGLKCMDCHTKIFQMKYGTMEAGVADHNAGEKFCWTCHNGTKAFETKGNCNKCHVK
jgi:c(7)-type cytochrome triheme protein